MAIFKFDDFQRASITPQAPSPKIKLNKQPAPVKVPTKQTEQKVTASPFLVPGENAMTSEANYIKKALSGLDAYKPSGGVDLGGIYSAYDQEASASRMAVQDATRTKRNDLTAQIQRLREDIANSKKAKMDVFNTTRADLNDSAFMTNRSNRISAASRGLSGSGLEQLAQIQSMLKTNKQISDVAGVYSNEQKGLETSLQRGEQDYNNTATNLTNEEQIALQQIAANLSGKKASAKSQADAQNAVAQNNYQRMLLEATSAAKDKYNYMKAKATTVIDALKQGKLDKKSKEAAQADIRTAYDAQLIDPDTYSYLTKAIEKLKK
jgi:hypothetical protein